MKYILLPVSCLALLSTALELVRSDSPSTVLASVQRRSNVGSPVARDRLRKRDGTVQESIDNEGTLYFANVTVGTPPQKFKLHLDTGSSDLWLNTNSSQLCSEKTGNRPSPGFATLSVCSDSGTYTANSSSSYKYLNSDFNITYADGTGAAGDYVTDNLQIGNLTIENLQFGVGYQSTSTECVLGLGYGINEAAVTFAHDEAYNNLPAAMSNTGVIGATAFSLWLNDLEANEGSILFGGVDTAKFQGSLQTMPIIQTSGVFSQFVVALTAVGQNGNVGSIANNQKTPILLDSGSSLTYLPDDIADSLIQAYNAQYNDNEGAAYLNCNTANSGGSVEFTLSGVTISVPTSELVLPSNDDDEDGDGGNSQESCLFGISRTGSDVPTLGDTFLRSAYVVYDMSNNEIGLAQTDFNATESNIVMISGGSAGVPSATPVQSPVTSVTGLLQTGAGRIKNSGGSTGAGAMVTPPPVMKYGGMAAAGLGVALVL